MIFLAVGLAMASGNLYAYSIENYEDNLKIKAENGNAKAQSDLAVMYAIRQDYQRAFEWTKKSAEQGLPKAQFILGTLYEKGQGVNQDYQIKKTNKKQKNGSENLAIMEIKMVVIIMLN